LAVGTLSELGFARLTGPRGPSITVMRQLIV
jgi:hypothetical protein